MYKCFVYNRYEKLFIGNSIEGIRRNDFTENASPPVETLTNISRSLWDFYNTGWFSRGGGGSRGEGKIFQGRWQFSLYQYWGLELVLWIVLTCCFNDRISVSRSKILPTVFLWSLKITSFSWATTCSDVSKPSFSSASFWTLNRMSNVKIKVKTQRGLTRISFRNLSKILLKIF